MPRVCYGHLALSPPSAPPLLYCPLYFITALENDVGASYTSHCPGAVHINAQTGPPTVPHVSTRCTAYHPLHLDNACVYCTPPQHINTLYMHILMTHVYCKHSSCIFFITNVYCTHPSCILSTQMCTAHIPRAYCQHKCVLHTSLVHIVNTNVCRYTVHCTSPRAS